jgi:Ca-activated chloride channel family protein
LSCESNLGERVNTSGSFQFVEPGWLWFGMIAAVVLVVLQRLAARRRLEKLRTLATASALPELTRSHSAWRRWIKDVVLVIAVLLTGASLARPQWGSIESRDEWLAEDVVFALDCSRSMLAEDVQPDRMQRAKFAVLNFVQKQATGRVGLVAFAGSAFLQCPLTFDYEAFNDALSEMNERTIPVGGTDIGRALDESLKAMDTKTSRKLIVLLTDGEDLEKSGVATAARLATNGAAIYTIGVGTAAGVELRAMNAQGQMDFVRERGEIVRSKLDEKTLGEIARAGGGDYFPLGRLGEGLMRVKQHMHSARAAEAARSRTQAIDRYHVPLAVVILLLLAESFLGTRRLGTGFVRERGIIESAAPRSLSGIVVLMVIAAFVFLTTRVNGGESNGSGGLSVPTNAAPKFPPPKTPREFFNSGTRLLAAKKYADAETAFKSTLTSQVDSLRTPALFNLGCTRYLQGLADLEKTADEKQIVRNIQSAETRARDAVMSAEAAMAANDTDQMVAAYLRGRGARKEIKAVREQVKQTMETYGKTLERWRRAQNDFRGAVELNPSDADAAENVKRVEEAIAELIDRIRKLMEAIMAKMGGPKPKFDDMMQQLKGKIPEDKMPPGAPGDEEEEDGGIRLEELRDRMESPGKEGEERELPLSREQAEQMLEGFKMDGTKRLPMTPDPNGKPGKPFEKKLKDW